MSFLVPHGAPRPGRRTPVLAIWLVLGCALGSTGFAHESVQSRREPARRGWRATLRQMIEEAQDEAWRRPLARWRRPEQGRRSRGRGFGRSAAREPLVQRYDFSDQGGGGVATALSADVIRATLRHHDDRLGACLLRHGAKGVEIQFEVGSAGRLEAVRLDLEGAAERCLRQVLGGVRFPSRPGGRAKGTYQIRMQ